MYQQFPPGASLLALPLIGDKGQPQSLLSPLQCLLRRVKGCQSQRKAPPFLFSFELSKCSKIGAATAGESWVVHVELVLWAIPFHLDSSIIFKLKNPDDHTCSGLLLSHNKIGSWGEVCFPSSGTRGLSPHHLYQEGYCPRVCCLLCTSREYE